MNIGIIGVGGVRGISEKNFLKDFKNYDKYIAL